MRTAFLVIALLAVAGCATKAQQEVSRIGGVASADAPGIDACWAKVLKSPQHQALRGKMADYSDSPTLAMKINTDRATAGEAAQLLSLHQEYLSPCRKMAMESAGKVDPVIVAILAESYANTDVNYAKFVGREITWGEFVTENQALVTERRARLLAAGEKFQKNLKDSAPPDTSSQQQAAAALSNWTHRQEILLGQQKTNSVNQPRVTSCRYDGSTLNCTLLRAGTASQG
jgi:hypothetical protein